MTARKRLETGCGEVRPEDGKGIYVKEASSGDFLTQLEFTKEKELLLEVLEARKILEKEIVALAVKNITDSELSALGEVLTVIMRKYERGERQNMDESGTAKP